MKTLIGTAAVAATATFVLMQAFGANAPSRPPGVSANEWAPINDTLGVVLVDQQLTAMDAPIITPSPASGAATRTIGAGATLGGSGGAALLAPISGYLMVKRGSTWQRLVVIDPVKGPGAAG